MPNPTVNFRLSPYQIARGLWIIRKLEPNYQPTSISKIVKVLYLDYLAKMSYGRTDIVPAELVSEVKNMINCPGTKKEITLDTLIQAETNQEFIPQVERPKEDGSIINTVTDLRPSADWMDDLNNDDD